MRREGDVSLMSVLKRRISLLLRDKEETAMTTAVANSWLSNEAASFQAINRAGTFRSLLHIAFTSQFNYSVIYSGTDVKLLLIGKIICYLLPCRSGMPVT